MAHKDHKANLEKYQRELIELSLEYIGFCHRMEDLNAVDRRRMNQIERRVYNIYETHEDEISPGLVTHFQVFANLVYQYRILPEISDTVH